MIMISVGHMNKNMQKNNADHMQITVFLDAGKNHRINTRGIF